MKKLLILLIVLFAFGAAFAALTEGFEGTTFPPEGWRVINGGGANTWVRSSSAYHTGSYGASITYNATAHDDYLITPKLAVTTSNYTFSFWARSYSSSYLEAFDVKLSTGTNNVADFTVTLAEDITAPYAWTQFTYNLQTPVDYTGQNVYLAVRARSTDKFYLYLDDFSGPDIYVANDPEPTNHVTDFAAGTIGYTSIPLTWTGSTGAQLPAGYLIQAIKVGTGSYISVTDTNPVANDAVWTDGNAAINVAHVVGANTYTFTGLTANTAYEFKIWPYTNSGALINYKVDDPIPTVNASTLDPTQALDYSQDFNSGTSLPAINWTGDMSISSTHGNAGTNGLYKNLYSYTTTTNAVTPPIGPMTDDCQILFDYRIVNYSGYPSTGTTLGASDKIEVQVSTDNGANFTTIYTIDSTNHVTSNAFATLNLPVTAYDGDIILVKFLSTWGAGDYYVDIDNVIVRETPESPIISVTPDTWDFGTQLINTTTAKEFTISNIGAGSLNVSSINVTGTGFALAEAFSPVSLLPTQSTTITVNFNPLTETTYSGSIVINDNRATTNIPLTGAAIDATIYTGDLPYLENFDAVTVPALPVGWATVPGTTGSVRTQTSNASSLPNTLYMYSSGASSIAMVSLPPVSLSSTNLRIKFNGRSNVTAGGIVDIGSMTDINDPATFTLIGSRTLSTLTYQAYSVDLGTVNGVMNYAIRASYTPANSILLDDITFEIPAALPPEPATLVWPLNGITTLLNPLLKWAPSATGEPATSYKVYMNDSGTFTETDLIYEGTATQFQTADMGYERTYYWKVLPINAHGSDPTCPTWSFLTPLENQLAEGFESTTFPPVGWQRTTSSSTYWGRSTTSPLEGTAGMYAYTSTSTVYTISTPMLTINSSSSLDFFAKVTDVTQKLQILESTDRINWTQVGADITFATANVWNPISVNLSVIDPGNYYLAFSSPGQTTGYKYIYVDHIIGPEITPLVPGTPALTAPANAAVNQSNYPSFTWTAPTTGGVPSGYNLYLDTVDGSTLYASNVTSPYVPTTALDWEVTYYWTVKALNNAGTGDAPAARSFTVRSDPTIYVDSTTPWLVDFGTSSSDTFPPTNWTRLSGLFQTDTPTTTSSGWLRDDWLNGASGNNAAKVNIYGTSCKYWLVTPPISIPATGYELKFDLGLTDYTYSTAIEFPEGQADDRFIVVMSESPSMSNPTILREYNNSGSDYVYNNIPNTGSTVSIPLTGVSGTKYFAFYGESTVSVTGEDNDLFVDNVLIRETVVAAPDPVTLISPADEAENMPVDGFNLTWSPAVTGGTPTGYYVIMGSTADPDYMEYFWELSDVNSFDPTQAAEDPITFSYGDTWYWTVIASNGEGDSTTPTPFSFTIMDDPRVLSLPYSQNFDGVSAPALPAAFVKLGTGTVQTQTTNNYSAPNCLYMYSSGTTTISMLVLPDVVLNNVHAKLSFMGRANFTAGGIVQVGYLTDPTDPATFVVIDQVTMASLTYASYEVDLGTINGTMHYALRANPVSPFNSLLIDNLELTEIVPIDMSVVSLTGMPYGFQNTALTHTVTVKNNGSVEVNNYTVYLKSVDGRAILGQESFTDPLAANATNAVEFTWTPTMLGSTQIYGEVLVAGDAVAENNVSEAMTFDVLQEGILFEDFEGGVIPANWTVLNADGGTQVWQAQTANPRTGTYAARVRYETSSLDNDDWLITPPLQVTSGTTDNISFWMRSYSATDADPWQVLISTTDTNPASFTMIDEGDGMLANYVQKSYNLDSYGDAVIYLAVRYMGAWDWYLYVDDFVGPPIFTPTALATPDVTISTVGSNVVLNWAAIPYATSYEVMAADAPEGPYTLAATVTAPTYSSAATSKKFFKVIAKAGTTRSITTPALSLEQQLLQDEMDKAARYRQ